MEPSLTLGLDFERGRIFGEVDGLAAVQQAAKLALETPRFQHVIFSGEYGSEVDTLRGKHRDLIRGELERLIAEALTQDDRIEGVEDFSLEFSGDEVICQFTVVSAEGSFTMERRMELGV